jgi:hypothetical protein
MTRAAMSLSLSRVRASFAIDFRNSVLATRTCSLRLSPINSRLVDSLLLMQRVSSTVHYRRMYLLIDYPLAGRFLRPAPISSQEPRPLTAIER